MTVPKNSDKQPITPKKLDTHVMTRIGKSISEMPIRVSNIPEVEDQKPDPPKDNAS